MHRAALSRPDHTRLSPWGQTSLLSCYLRYGNPNPFAKAVRGERVQRLWEPSWIEEKHSPLKKLITWVEI